MKLKLCKWRCGRRTQAHSGICLECTTERDRHDKAIDAGTEKYIPPEQRPGHRFFKRRQRSEAQKAGIAKGKATKAASKRAERPTGEAFDR